MMKFAKLRAKHIALGARGEHLAKKLLLHYGMEFVVKNWRCAAGELDLVMRDGDTFIFVEVKTKRKLNRYLPRTNLSNHQLKRNIAAAKTFVKQKKLLHYHMRFDLVEVIATPWVLKSIVHHKNFITPPSRG